MLVLKNRTVVFSSITFLVYFLPLFFLLYQACPKPYKNACLLLGSIVFYAWGAPRFIFLILLTTAVDFVLVQKMQAAQSEKQRKRWLYAAIGSNLALLFYFKYCNFFIENVNAGLSFFGAGNLPLLQVVLPIGISFYTFESLTYSIDVYRRVHAPLKRFWDYQLYIIFFPKLIAGPIVRYHEIADQLLTRHDNYDKIVQGFMRFVIGLAKKVLIANTMAHYANDAFGMPPEQINSSVAWIGMLSYTFQIYFDFSGYSDMALGLAAMFGFNLPENFDSPYSSKSISEFWRRWHMSLGRWMRNYLYVPLGGNRNSSNSRTYLNLCIVFFASGLWHGAGWTFVIWGLYHGLFLVIERAGFSKVLDKIPAVLRVAYSFLVVAIGWLFFRADTLTQASTMFKALFSFNWGSLRFPIDAHFASYLVLAFVCSFFVLLPGGNTFKEKMFAENNRGFSMLWQVCIIVLVFTYALAALASNEFNPFIYFRF
jgi:alginate O-acetyltransferase complex protein AlgI